MEASVKQAFDLLPGLPPRGDGELGKLMDVVSRLPREGADEIVRCLLRAALAHRRTGSPAYLVTLAEDALVTIGLRRHPELGRALREAPARPAQEPRLTSRKCFGSAVFRQ